MKLKQTVKFRCRRNAVIAVFLVTLLIAIVVIAAIVSAAVNSPRLVGGYPTGGPIIRAGGKPPVPIMTIPKYIPTTETTTEATTEYVATLTGVSFPVEEVYDLSDDLVEAVTVDWKPMVDDGDPVIEVDDTTLTRKNLPNAYYNIDFSTFQPYMDVDCITSTGSSAYKLCNSYDTYSDEYGLMRKPSDGFTVDGEDDYIVALGNYYKAKGSIGDRFLVATTTGYYTIVVGDEKDDGDTDPYNMYSYHGNYAGLIEFIVQTHELTPMAKRMGSIHDCGNPIFAGDIIRIYRIE